MHLGTQNTQDVELGYTHMEEDTLWRTTKQFFFFGHITGARADAGFSPKERCFCIIWLSKYLDPPLSGSNYLSSSNFSINDALCVANGFTVFIHRGEYFSPNMTTIDRRQLTCSCIVSCKHKFRHIAKLLFHQSLTRHNY